MAVLDIVRRDGLGLAVCLSFLIAGILARPTWRLPLRTLFVLTASCKALLYLPEHRFAIFALYTAIALYGMTQARQDTRSVLHQRNAALSR